jgi:hypothetical protein
MATSTEMLDDIVQQLDLAVAGPQTAYGEVHGLPVTLTVLGDAPLTLMFEFRLHESAETPPPPRDLGSELSSDKLTISFSKGRAWLSCIDLPAEAVGGIVECFAETLGAAGQAFAPGCVRCGDAEAHIVHVHGDTSRLCAACLNAALADQQQRQSQLDRSNKVVLLGLPAVLTIVSVGWAVFWTLVDVSLTALQLQVIELNQLTMLLLLAIAAAAGAALGMPLGAALRKSGTVRAAPHVLSGLIAAGVVAGGEVLYVALLLYRIFGVLDLAGAARLMPAIVQLYGEFVGVSRIVVALITGACCIWTASQTPKARVQI